VGQLVLSGDRWAVASAWEKGGEGLRVVLVVADPNNPNPWNVMDHAIAESVAWPGQLNNGRGDLDPEKDPPHANDLLIRVTDENN
jgi:hypothetical protein